MTIWNSVENIAALPVMLGDAAVKGILLAQELSDPDILGQIKRAWDNFVETGQIWALIIGMILGYLFRGFRGS